MIGLFCSVTLMAKGSVGMVTFTTHTVKMCSLLISKGRQRSREMFGYEPKIIMTPYNKNQIDQLMQHNEDWILSLQGFMGQISYHFPRHPLVEFAKHVEVIFPVRVSSEPLDRALYIFTDSSSSGRAMIFTHEGVMRVETGTRSSVQQAEIRAVILALEKFPQTFNL